MTINVKKQIIEKIDDLIGWSPILCEKCYPKVRDELEELKKELKMNNNVKDNMEKRKCMK